MPDPAVPPPPAPAAPPPPPEDRLVRTVHSAVVGGRELAYTVTCGTIVLREESETKDGDEGRRLRGRQAPRRGVGDRLHAGRRPGPHRPAGHVRVQRRPGLGVGVAPPRLPRAAPRDGARGASCPARSGWSTTSTRCSTSRDLVFIDPVSTGYSRAVVGEKAKQFHGFQRDIESVSEVIRLWTTRNRRWTSPKFLIGESYGTTARHRRRGVHAGPLRPLPERADARLVRARLRPARVRRAATTRRTSASSPPTPPPPGTTDGSRPTCRPTCGPRSPRSRSSPSPTTRSRSRAGRSWPTPSGRGSSRSWPATPG